MYPEVVEITPGSLSNGGSMHQKHPPANVAFAVVALGAAFWAYAGAAANAAQASSRAKILMAPPAWC
jgi:hypothetical protein